MIKYTNDNDFIQTTLDTLNEEDRLQVLRREREKLFTPFNIYCVMQLQGTLPNVQKESHQSVLEWYQNILDLDSTSIFNPPQIIRYFLGNKL